MGGDLLCLQIKELEEGGLLFAQSEESQRDWGVTGSLQGLWLYNQTPKAVCSTD